MSVESMAIALHHSRASGTAKLVLLGIANHDGDGGAWPSLRTLAKYANVSSRKNIQNALNRLEELGEVRRMIQHGGDERTPDHLRPNRYLFLLSCPTTCDHSRNHRTRNEVTLSIVEYPASLPTREVATDAGGASVATPKPSLNSTTKTKEKISSPKREALTPDDPTYCMIFGHNSATFTPSNGTCKNCSVIARPNVRPLP